MFVINKQQGQRSTKKHTGRIWKTRVIKLRVLFQFLILFKTLLLEGFHKFRIKCEKKNTSVLSKLQTTESARKIKLSKICFVFVLKEGTLEPSAVSVLMEARQRGSVRRSESNLSLLQIKVYNFQKHITRSVTPSSLHGLHYIVSCFVTLRSRIKWSQRHSCTCWQRRDGGCWQRSRHLATAGCSTTWHTISLWLEWW
jgi:hypothetical protein